MNKQRFSASRSAKLVPVTIGGIAVAIDLKSIDTSKRKVHHGKFGDTQVNSPATLQIGDSVLIWPDAEKKDVAFTMDVASLGVLATQYLEDNGRTVT